MVKILITGFPSLKSAIEAVNSEADGYVFKPIDAWKLLKIIRERLDKKTSEYIITHARNWSPGQPVLHGSLEAVLDSPIARQRGTALEGAHPAIFEKVRPVSEERTFQFGSLAPFFIRAKWVSYATSVVVEIMRACCVTFEVAVE